MQARIVGLIVMVALTAGPGPAATAMEPPPDIIGGQGVRNDFLLADDIHATLENFERMYGTPIDRRAMVNYAEGGGMIDTGYGVVLHFDNYQNIWQIVILSSQMFTDRWVRVYSHRDEVFRAYGTSYSSQPLDSGYYLRYDWAGIGFDIDGTTNLVRAIVVFDPTR